MRWQGLTLVVVATLVACLTQAPLAQSQGVMIKNGFLTGNSYRADSPASQRRYIAGIIDGMFLAPLFGAPKSDLAWMEGCVTGMTDGQVTAIVDKFMNETPERWHEQMHTLVYSALKVACDKR